MWVSWCLRRTQRWRAGSWWKSKPGEYSSVVLLRDISSISVVEKDYKKLALLVIPITTFALGTWQIFRLQRKVRLIEDLERKTAIPPMQIPADVVERMEQLEYRKLAVHGHFDHSREIQMWPRSLLERDPSHANRPGSGSEPGAQVITPFYCQELQKDILVNRGWVPMRKISPESRARGQIEGEIALSGILRTSEKKGMFCPKNEPEKNRWAWRDIPAMADHLETEPVMIDADAKSTVYRGPIGGQTRVTLRNDHMQYIFTWYALAVATGFMFWKLWTIPKRRRYK